MPDSFFTCLCSLGGFAFGAKYVGQVAQLSNKLDDVALESSSKAAIIPSDLDGELTQQLQRISKRDPTTRLKALQVSSLGPWSHHQSTDRSQLVSKLNSISNIYILFNYNFRLCGHWY